MPDQRPPNPLARTVPAPGNLPVPSARAAQMADQPSVQVGHVPQSLLPPNTARAAPVLAPVAPSAAPPAALAEPPTPRLPAVRKETPDADDADDLRLPALSQEHITFLSSTHYQESDTRLQRIFAVSKDDLAFLNEMDHMVLGGALGLDAYIRAMRGEFPDWDAATRDRLIGHLLAERFVPWGNRLRPSAEEAAQEAGITLPSVPYYSTYRGALTYRGAATEIGKMIRIPFTPNMVDRLAALVKSQAKGVRVAAQAEVQLVRPLDRGGLGLEPEQARAAVIALDDLLQRVQLTEDTAEERSFRSTEPRSSVSPIATPRAPHAPRVSSRTNSDTEAEEDEKEIAAVAARMPRLSPGTERAHVLPQAVQAVMGRLTGIPKDSYLLRRLENIVSTRLRDVRSRNEVFSTLSRGQKVGGLDLGRAEAERLTEEIEAGYAEWHERVAAETSLALESQTREQAAKRTAHAQQEAKEHAAWFAEKARAQQVLQSTPAPQALSLEGREHAREQAAFGTLVEAPTQDNTVASFLASVASTDASKAPVVAPPVPRQPVKISAASAAAASGTSPTRPRMDDVQSVQDKLAGPREELARLTLGAFRRLGKTPPVAAEHIRNLVRLLAEQSFNKRVEGIRAWQESPLHRQYVGLVADAFSSGTSLKDLLAKKRAAGEDVPTDEELATIVTLNGELRL